LNLKQKEISQSVGKKDRDERERAGERREKRKKQKRTLPKIPKKVIGGALAGTLSGQMNL
jgi:hypothetical protein